MSVLPRNVARCSWRGRTAIIVINNERARRSAPADPVTGKEQRLVRTIQWRLLDNIHRNNPLIRIALRDTFCFFGCYVAGSMWPRLQSLQLCRERKGCGGHAIVISRLASRLLQIYMSQLHSEDFIKTSQWLSALLNPACLSCFAL